MKTSWIVTHQKPGRWTWGEDGSERTLSCTWYHVVLLVGPGDGTRGRIRLNGDMEESREGHRGSNGNPASP
jgi:hypothetical protein